MGCCLHALSIRVTYSAGDSMEISKACCPFRLNAVFVRSPFRDFGKELASRFEVTMSAFTAENPTAWSS